MTNYHPRYNILNSMHSHQEPKYIFNRKDVRIIGQNLLANLKNNTKHRRLNIRPTFKIRVKNLSIHHHWPETRNTAGSTRALCLTGVFTLHKGSRSHFSQLQRQGIKRVVFWGSSGSHIILTSRYSEPWEFQLNCAASSIHENIHINQKIYQNFRESKLDNRVH